MGLLDKTLSSVANLTKDVVGPVTTTVASTVNQAAPLVETVTKPVEEAVKPVSNLSLLGKLNILSLGPWIAGLIVLAVFVTYLVCHK